MKIRRTIPPAASPISFLDLLHGLGGIGKNNAIAKLEKEIKKYFGKNHVFLISSGKAALYVILTALRKLSGKNRVIIPAYTCYSVPSAIRMAGLDIVLCDVRPDTLDFDHSELRKLVDDDILCIIPTHLFGIPSDIAAIRTVCGKRRIFVVEDAAQAMGVFYGNTLLGTFGDVTFFSLGRGKNITCGSGGFVITSEEDIAESIRHIVADIRKVPIVEYARNILETVFQMIFIHPNLYWIPKGLPFLKLGETEFHMDFPVYKFTGFQAGLLHNWRGKLESYNNRRATNAGHYLNLLQGGKQLPLYANGFQYLRFPFFLESKEKKEELCRNGDSLGISPMYPDTINNIPEIKERYSNMHFTKSQRIADTLVTLPTHVLLNERDRVKISDCVMNYQKYVRSGDTVQ